MGMHCLYFNEVLLLIKSSLSKYVQYCQQFSNMQTTILVAYNHTENLLTELCLKPLVIVGNVGMKIWAH